MHLSKMVKRLPGVLLLPAFIALTFSGESEPFAPGRPFPALVLPSADDGRPMSIESFRGRKVLLHVFASW